MPLMLSNTAGASVSRLAVAAGAVQLIGLLSLIEFFVGGEPFGTLNDLCIALTGVLSAALAWQLLAAFPAQPAALGRLVLGLAVLGALIVAAGSVLVITRTTSFVLAGLWMEFGYAWIGAWLLVVCVFAPASWPRGLLVLGVVAAGLMLLGIMTLPGLARGLDAWEALPWYVNVGQASALGWLLLYHIWCLWLGRIL